MRATALALLAAVTATPAMAEYTVKEIGSFHVGGRTETLSGLRGKEGVFSPGGPSIRIDPNDGRTVEAIREAEREIKEALGADGVSGEKVPEIAISMQKLQERPFAPSEGFVLSRINGQWDVKSIMKISPMKELEVLMIFQKFLKDGVIRWKARP